MTRATGFLPLGATFRWDTYDGTTSQDHIVGAGRCPACCCLGPEHCKDCGGFLHQEPDESGHYWHCDRPYCRCWACPDLATGTGWPKEPEGWRGNHREATRPRPVPYRTGG
jgi:hypothetical protein